MTELAGKYAGLDRFEARKRIVADMQALGLIDRIEPYRHAVGICYRCKTVVEPLVSKQWFVTRKPLAEPAIEAVRSGKHQDRPAHVDQDLLPLDGEHPRLVHLAPALVGPPHPGLVLRRGRRACTCPAPTSPRARSAAAACARTPTCSTPGSRPGSGRSPRSAGPSQTPELKTFYPTSVLVTGFDILFFWVARMAMLGIEFMGDVPFRHVYIHALVRDADGQKMSKTKGNVVDPLSVMDQYGTDAFRFTLAALAAQGRDIRLTEERIEGYRNFANKIWNAARLVLTNLEGYDPALARRGTAVGGRPLDQEPADRDGRPGARRRSTRIASTTPPPRCTSSSGTSTATGTSRSPSAASTSPKVRRRKAVTQRTLVETLETTLRLLHPFMPFISEELWQRLPHAGRFDHDRALPEGHAQGARRGGGAADGAGARLRERDPDGAEREPDLARGGAGGDGQARALRWPPRSTSNLAVIGSLARAAITVSVDGARPAGSAVATTSSGDVFVRLEGVVDFEAERQRLRKEIERARKEIAFLEGKLGRPDFVERAPAEVVERERERLGEQRQIEQKLAASLTALE